MRFRFWFVLVERQTKYISKKEIENFEESSHLREIFLRQANRTVYRGTVESMRGIREAKRYSHSRYLHRPSHVGNERQPSRLQTHDSGQREKVLLSRARLQIRSFQP